MASREAPVRDDPDSEDRSDFWKIWGFGAAVVIAGFVVAYQFLDDPPPRELTVVTGSEGGGYDSAGEFLKARLAESGITVELVRTAGSSENLERLHAGEADIGFVQGGTVDDPTGLAGVASLYYEPLWIFHRRGYAFASVGDLNGARIEIGAPGSGTQSMVRRILRGNGVKAEDATLLEHGPDEAVAALRNGDADILFLVLTPDADRIQELFADDAVVAFSLPRAVAYTRHFRYLEPLVLTPGMLDLDANLPASDVHLVSPTASLVARADLHPAIHPLLIEAMEARFGAGDLFADEGEFPNPKNLEAPIAESAERYFENGRSFLYRVLPFQLAAVIDRLKIMLLPLATLLLPLVRLAPPVYRWRIRSRIYKWYRLLLKLETRVRRHPDVATIDEVIAEMARMDVEIAEVKVPLSYAEELYNVRLHIRQLREELGRQRLELAGA